MLIIKHNKHVSCQKKKINILCEDEYIRAKNTHALFFFDKILHAHLNILN